MIKIFGDYALLSWKCHLFFRVECFILIFSYKISLSFEWYFEFDLNHSRCFIFEIQWPKIYRVTRVLLNVVTAEISLASHIYRIKTIDYLFM